MKIRCKNCFKTLRPNEEYCTYCGERSEEVAQLMKKGVSDIDSTTKLKLALVLYGILGFVGTGIFIVVFSLLYKKVGTSTMDFNVNANSLLVTSLVLLFVLLITYSKELKSMMFNGNIYMFGSTLLVGGISIVAIFLLSKISSFTKVVPSYMTEYINGGDRYLQENNGLFSIACMYISMIAVVVVEEIVFRRRLVDALDDDTLLSERWVLVIAALFSTFLDFIWVMSIETLFMSFIINLIMTLIYMNTNRSIGVNILLRIILVTLVFLF